MHNVTDDRRTQHCPMRDRTNAVSTVG